MNLAKGYSIWLIPEDQFFNELKPLISELQKLVKQPEFDPHITLVSGFRLREPEILQRTEVLAKSNDAFTLETDNSVWGYTFFQRYYYDIKPSESLTKLHKSALFMYGESELHDYHPHLSLQYADHTQIPNTDLLNRIRSFHQRSFKIDRLQIMLTDGKISDWKGIGSFGF